MLLHGMVYAFTFATYGVAQGAGEREDLDDDGAGCEKCISMACCPFPLAYAALIAIGSVVSNTVCFWTGVGLLADWLLFALAATRAWMSGSSPLEAFNEWGEEDPTSTATTSTAEKKTKAAQAATKRRMLELAKPFAIGARVRVLNVDEPYARHFNTWSAIALGAAFPVAFTSLAEATGQVGHVTFKTSEPVMIKVYFESKGGDRPFDLKQAKKATGFTFASGACCDFAPTQLELVTESESEQQKV